eukprot:m.99738 g.99738  ORF g.99738 m.99738 type:complete len:253 (-) comp14913_c1_seq9:2280-3038(-)
MLIGYIAYRSRHRNDPRDRDLLGRHALPIMRPSAAMTLCVINIILPGFGTMIAGALVLCGVLDPPSERRSKGRTASKNLLMGFLQLLLAGFILVGWIWSIIWGLCMISDSSQWGHERSLTPEETTVEGHPSSATTTTVTAPAQVTVTAPPPSSVMITTLPPPTTSHSDNGPQQAPQITVSALPPATTTTAPTTTTLTATTPTSTTTPTTTMPLTTTTPPTTTPTTTTTATREPHVPTTATTIFRPTTSPVDI